MIALCTGTPAFDVVGENTVVSFPSGKGEFVRISLTRHQLGLMTHASTKALTKAFDAPKPDVAKPVPFRPGRRG